MADEVTSGEVRTRQFDVVRKGYDRNQVESFLALVARQIDELTDRIGETSQTDIALGLDDPEALARELSAIGDEVGAILEAARNAADGLRSRAASDVEEWTSEAKERIEKSTADAADQSRAMREAAWSDGSTMLESALSEASRVTDQTEADTLRIRAEAEREAIRYTGDAKRASEEAIGAAENEADVIVARARSESEGILVAAHQSAELAQERARALEDRREELLTELETARSSIGELETTIESRRQILEEPEPLVEVDQGPRSHHGADGGSVKIVSGSAVVPLTPVDADSFVAEVEALHQHQSDDDPVVPESVVPDVTSFEPSEATVQEVLDDDALTDESQPDPKREPELQPDADKPPHIAPVIEIHDVDEGSDTDAIGSLFAQLRQDNEQPIEKSVESADVDSEQRATSESPEVSDEVDELQDEVQEPETADEVVSLIPMQNSALRSIKRMLVDLQNDTLEHLRTDKSWVPDEAYTDRFGEAFGELAEAVSGDSDDGGAASAFAADLYDSVSSAVVSSREAGSGDRAVAASASRVFRTWRSDEAERRVVSVAAALSANNTNS